MKMTSTSAQSPARVSTLFRDAACLAVWLLACMAMAASTQTADGAAEEGVFVRFKMTEPAEATYYMSLRGYIHKPNWYITAATFPAGADKDAAARLKSGQWSNWFDIGAWAGKSMHGRMNRSGGVAEFPNVRVTLIGAGGDSTTQRRLMIELATSPVEADVVKRFDDQFTGDWTSFLVSPNLKDDAAELETFSQMTARHLAWAKDATGGVRHSPRELLVQTSFYGPNMVDAEALSLLGFNVVGGTTPEIRAAYPHLRQAGHSHSVAFGPAATAEQIDAIAKKHAAGAKDLPAGVLFNFTDEIVARPAIGTNEQALVHFHQWLKDRKLDPQTLGVASLDDVAPIEHPDQLAAAQKINQSAANRVFYYTSRFRQEIATERLRWSTEAFHRHSDTDVRTSSLVADHPYFAGTGLGMGLKTSNAAWGNYPLALDWFDLARDKAVDVIGIEDWMGLQYMYGPRYTWEGFQLMGFQASIFRSGSRGQMPIMSWVTPSDETNLRLKTASSLAQGAKHFFYWTFGPTALGTENYWSDLRGSYDGVAAVTRQLAASEHIIAPGKTRPTRVALLYSVSADLWQPFDYIHMLERRGLYLSLVHQQYLVDMLTEEDIEAGRLADYDVLYAADANIREGAATIISGWVGEGGHLFASAGAGSRNAFDEPASILADVFGIAAKQGDAQVQQGAYHIRGALNEMTYMDRITLDSSPAPSGKDATDVASLQSLGVLGVLGVKLAPTPTTGKVVGRFADGKPAVIVNAWKKGRATYVAACPGLSYIKDAKFVPRELKEQWPGPMRRWLGAAARDAGALPLVEACDDVVEVGIYDAPAGTAVVLANFTYQPIDTMTLRIPLPAGYEAATVRSTERGPLETAVIEPSAARYRDAGLPLTMAVTMPLDLNDIVLIEK